MPVRPVWPRSAIRQFLGSGASQILGSALLGATPVIDRLMVSSLGPGRLSILEYAERAWQVPLALAMSGFMVVSVSEWSRAAPGAVAIRPLTRATVRTAGMLFAGSVPVCLAAIAARHWLVTLVFGHGRLTPEELVVLGDVFGLFTVALPVYAVGLVYTRAVLVLKRSDILLGINIGQLAVKLALNVLLVRSWGVAGVALSSAGMYGLGTAILVIGYHARLTRATGRPAP
jgi:putative peptidoglycan lipid II flippase